jgi:hypothetical protein
VARSGTWLAIGLAIGSVACGRARAEHGLPPPPASQTLPRGPEQAAPSSKPANAPPPAPAAREPEISAAEHDRALLPCPRGQALCEPQHPIMARGVLLRAERYLAHCRECRQRDRVQTTLARARAVAVRDQRERRLRELADCRSSDQLSVLVSPDSVVAGDRPRLIVAGDEPLVFGLEVSADGAAAPRVTHDESHAGPPWSRVLTLDPVSVGKHRVVVRNAQGEPIACRRFNVTEHRRQRFRRDSIWISKRGWDGASENLYSAWIAHAFDAPEGKRWQGIGAVTTDPSRNFLHNHLGLGEDTRAERLALRPDCADAPYVLRAYFAWKLGLPFGRHRCRFGETDGPPRCGEWASNDTPESDPLALVTPAEPPGADDAGRPELRPVSAWEFRTLVERLLEHVTARSLRTALADDATDLYPVALRREHLRPGVVFSDPYGHTLTIVKWVPQTASRPGKLLAVDAQPDGTLGIRRFWRGNFLFADRHPIGGFGFKAFRPIVLEPSGPRLLENAELAVADGYGGFSLEQAKLGAVDFYARMSRLVSPTPLPAEQELDELVEALHAQLERRVQEVAIADEIVRDRKRPIEMPEGREIFRTTGAWEAVSTPCRDLRLLVGMDALLAFPEQAARAHTAPALEKQLAEHLARQVAQRSIGYLRSDGSTQRLSLAELLARRTQLEMAYNPNDCAELRWGAAEGSSELSSCRRRAPDAQRRAMKRIRHWFVRRYACG